jgi:hypothetical protein
MIEYRVTTVEVDPAIADHARRALRRTGHPVTVVTADGTLGHPDNAPYDRVVATASATEVPHAWVAQTRPGGRIVLPLVGGFFERQAFLCLTVGGDGTARGRFHGAAGFMRLRGQRDDRRLWRVWNQEGAQVAATAAFPREPFAEFEAGFAVGLRLRGWVVGKREEPAGAAILMMSHFASGSWATVTSRPGRREHEVAHDGPRRLWEELDDACRWWTDAGRPDHTRFGATIAPEGQAFWLDTPDHVISQVLSSH